MSEDNIIQFDAWRRQAMLKRIHEHAGEIMAELGMDRLLAALAEDEERVEPPLDGA
jgi:hypothetical protein